MDTTYLYLIPAIIGYTDAIKGQFPSISKLGPFIALLVASLLYIGAIHLPAAYFGLLYATGSAMGVYSTVIAPIKKAING